MIAARQIFLGRGGAKLPYDAEVEYLSSDTKQWFDTGVLPADDIVVKISFMTITPLTQWGVVFGTGTNDSPRNNILIRNSANSNNKINAWFNQTSGTSPIIEVSEGTFIDATIKSGEFSIGLDTVAIPTSGTITNASTMYAFCGNNNGPWRNQRCRIAYIKIMKGNSLVRDFIPVRFTNEYGQSEGAMYDRVSKQLFRNQGTGAFGYGNDK